MTLYHVDYIVIGGPCGEFLLEFDPLDGDDILEIVRKIILRRHEGARFCKVDAVVKPVYSGLIIYNANKEL